MSDTAISGAPSGGPPLARELAEAAAAFRDAAEDRGVLRLLMLVNPIRAFEDAGIHLSKAARTWIARTYPECAYTNAELYDAVASGETTLDFITDVRLGRPRSDVGPFLLRPAPAGRWRS
jgi:hypothetical protein